MSAMISLPAKLNFEASLGLIEDLERHRGAPVTLNGADVDHLGGHALQTLMIAAKTWAEDGHTFLLTGLSPKVRDQISVFGAVEQAPFDTREDMS